MALHIQRCSWVGMLCGLLLSIGGLCSTALASGVVELYADFNNGPNEQIDGGLDRFKAAVFFDGRTLFSMRTPEHGTELWETDGTALGTRLFADICPGQCSSLDSAPSFHVEGGRLYFAAHDGHHGRELWRLDAGAEAPVLAVDINPGADSSNPGNFTRLAFSINGSSVTRTYFSATRPDVGNELWRLVGPSTATLELDLLPGTASGSPTDIQLCSTGQVCMLTRTESGVQDVRLLGYGSATAPPTGSSGVGGLDISGTVRSVADLQSLGSSTFVLVRDNSASNELRVFGSSAASSTLLRNVGSLNGLLIPNVALFRIFFAAGNQLLVSDGTVAGTQVISSATPSHLLSLGNRLLFAANGPSGRELFSSDGTAAGTGLLKELVPGPEGLPNSTLDLTITRSANGLRAFIGLQNPAFGVAGETQLWISDGTSVGTVEISGSAITDPGQMQVFPTQGNSALIGYSPVRFGGSEPYFTRGVVGSTLPLGNFVGDVGDSYAMPLGAIGQRLLVNAYSGPGTSPTVSLPLASGSPASPFPRVFNAIGKYFGRLWLEGSTGLLTTDGSTVGTLDVGAPGIHAYESACYVLRQGRVYFYANEGTFDDVEIFRSDGSAAGTLAVTQLSTPNQRRVETFCSAEGRVQIAAVGERLLFVAATAASGLELFALDANDNAALVMDIRSGSAGSQLQDFAVLRARAGGQPDLAVFRADDGIFGSEPWVTGGTAQTTRRLADLNTGSTGSNPRDFFVADGQVYFTAFSASSGRELYVTDGTPAGTRQVIDLFAGSGSGFQTPSPSRLHAFVDGRLYFSGISSSRPNCVLFETDGSAAGTRCAYDDDSQTLRSIGRQVLQTGSGALVFSAHRSSPVNDGEELRVLHGGRLLDIVGADLRAGPAGSAPSSLLLQGDDVYFQASDGEVGRELFRLRLADLGAVFADGFEP